MLDNLTIFSEKQRRFLRSEEWAPNKRPEDAREEEERQERQERPPSPEKREEVEVKESEREPEKAEEREAKAERAEKRNEREGKANEDTKDPGGWTFTIRERPMPDPSTGKKRRKGAEDSEAMGFVTVVESHDTCLVAPDRRFPKGAC